MGIILQFIKPYLGKFFVWLGLVMSGDSKASSKRVAFLFVVVSSVLWLSFDLHNHSITDNWLTAFQTLVISVVGGYLGGHGIDKMGKKKEEDKENEPN